MATSKRYDFKLTDTFRTKASLTEGNSSTPTFELDLGWLKDDRRKKPTHGVVLRSASLSDSESKVLGVADFSFSTLTVPIHLAFGDPDADPQSVVWEGMKCQNKVMTSPFELSVDLGGTRGRRVFDWKRTHDVENSNIITRKMDFLNFKMVERETDKVVARFVHSVLPGWKRGRFEIEAYDGGEEWEKVVLLSGSAMIEYARKITGWSW